MRIIINNIKKVLSILTIPFFFGAKCSKDGSTPCRNATYSFKVTASFHPVQDAYNIGDTIYLNSSFPKLLTDYISNENVNYGNSLGIFGYIGTRRFDSIQKKLFSASDSFLLINIVGNFLKVSSIKDLGINTQYLETTNAYNFSGAFVCKSKGIYSIALGGLNCNGLIGKNCTNAGFDLTVTNTTNKNLKYFSNMIGLDTTDFSFNKVASHTFRVQ